MQFNFDPYYLSTVPWTTPPILMQYLTSGGDWRAAVYGAGALVVSGMIYYPFFKMLEKQRLEIAEMEEAASENNQKIIEEGTT